MSVASDPSHDPSHDHEVLYVGSEELLHEWLRWPERTDERAGDLFDIDELFVGGSPPRPLADYAEIVCWYEGPVPTTEAARWRDQITAKAPGRVWPVLKRFPPEYARALVKLRLVKEEEEREEFEATYARLVDKRRVFKQADRQAQTELEEEERAKALEEASADFGWVDLADLWDAEPPRAEILARNDGSCAFYEGQRHMIVGKSESGKTWLALLAIVQEIRAGRPAALLDLENSPLVILDRLRSLGLAKGELELVRYVHLDAPLAPELAAVEAQRLHEEGGRLVVLDAMTPAATALGLELHGGDVNAVEKTFQITLDPWVRGGHAAVAIDNTPKGSDADPLGSQHKRAGCKAILAVVSDVRFSRKHRGRSKVILVKDRGGAVEYEPEKDYRLWASMVVSSDPTVADRTDVVLVAPEPPEEVTSTTVSIASVVDIVSDTCSLAGEALRKHGLTEVKSMRRLAELMDIVRDIDPTRFPAAHSDRHHIRDCLVKVATDSDRRDAGIGVEAVATTSTTRFRIFLLPS